MAYEAAITLYRKQYVAQFEQRSSLLKMCTTKESMMQGNTAVFLVAGSGTDTATTRGSNGYIPYGNPTNSQVSCSLAEKHAPYELTSFNVFVSQGNQAEIMRNNSIAVINREIDLNILAELANATQDMSGTMSNFEASKIKAALGYNFVDTSDEDNLFAVISPGALAYLEQATEFTNSLYVDIKPLVGPARKVRRWAGWNWIVSPLLTGANTSSELMYFFHRDALGYAINMGEESVRVGYDEKQDLSWTDATVYHGSKILQQTGIVKYTHDGSGFATT